jgi:PAS domain S-box-containing protein
MQEDYHLLVDSIKDYAIYMLDVEGRIATWNVGAQRMKGYSEAEILGQHFSLLFIPEDQEKKSLKKNFVLLLPRAGTRKKDGGFERMEQGFGPTSLLHLFTTKAKNILALPK